MPGAGEAILALEAALRDGIPFRLVLADSHMPDSDGFALAERIKRHSELQSTVIMMLSSDDGPDHVARCEELGIVSYLLKPIKQSELFDCIVAGLGITSAEMNQVSVAEGAVTQTRPLRILLAEDSPVNQKLAIGVLERYGHHIVVANHGKEAVAILAAQPAFDLVLMDVQMPEMDGYEATAKIRELEKGLGGEAAGSRDWGLDQGARPKTPKSEPLIPNLQSPIPTRHVPIIAMTAHAMKGDRERCLEAGMDAYIAKPIRAKKLLQTIEEVLVNQPASSNPPRGANREQFDWSEAREAVQGDEGLLRVVVEAMLEECPLVMAAIRQSLAGKDAAAVRLNSHRLKGAVRYFSSSGAYQAAYRLEVMGEQGNLDKAEEAFSALEGEIERLMPILVDYVRGG